ncbi:MAG: hypothetical protein IT391_06720 [Nitrospira sp.]|nr:hypothetical protein [Nitrospira sp.]
MNRNDFLVALFGRPVWFQCKRCRRVMARETQESSPDTWQEEGAAMEAWRVRPEDLWWFDTVCIPCEDQQRS